MHTTYAPAAAPRARGVYVTRPEAVAIYGRRAQVVDHAGRTLIEANMLADVDEDDVTVGLYALLNTLDWRGDASPGPVRAALVLVRGAAHADPLAPGVGGGGAPAHPRPRRRAAMSHRPARLRRERRTDRPNGPTDTRTPLWLIPPAAASPPRPPAASDDAVRMRTLARDVPAADLRAGDCVVIWAEGEVWVTRRLAGSALVEALLAAGGA
jgi:hypothetical protein